MTTITIANQKGGVGKTTTALNLGAFLGQSSRVLFLDLDPQGNLSHTLGVMTVEPTAFSVFSGADNLAHCLHPVGKQIGKCAALLPSSPLLAGADVQLSQAVGKEYKLREALENVSNNFDFCVVDTPPSLGVLSVNALTAADFCIVPAQADSYSLEGVQQFYLTFQTVQKYTNPSLRLAGILLTRFNARTVLAREVSAQFDTLAAEVKSRKFDTTIREATALKEAQTLGESIFSYAPGAPVTADYAAFGAEVLEVIHHV